MSTISKVKEKIKQNYINKYKKNEKKEESQIKQDDIIIRQEHSKIVDPMLMNLEEEVIGIINRKLEGHIAKKIKGLLLPLAKLSLKMKKAKSKFTGDQARYLSDLHSDLEYILENSGLEQVSPNAKEKFNPTIHEEVDFSWDSSRGELEILSVLREGFFWKYNQEMILKPQVKVNRRIDG
ncbi:MAG: nucleotide exchange factor GrpE [bacterium]